MWYKEISDLKLPQNFLEKIDTYATLLLEYTKTHNITALKDKSQVFENVVDSVYPIRYLTPLPKEIADIGSGAGFPAIPLALAFPNLQITLYEPLTKKSAFLHWIKAELNIQNIQIELQRVENETKKYGCIISRAVTNVTTLLKLCKKCSNAHTRFLLYKGSSVDEELNKEMNYEIFSRKNRNYVLLKDIVWL